MYGINLAPGPRPSHEAQTLTTGSSGVGSKVLEADRFSTIRLDLAVTDASGTSPTLDVTVEHGPAASGPWTTLGTFTQATGIGSEHKVLGPCDRFVRAKWAIGGTGPSFTFKVTGLGV